MPFCAECGSNLGPNPGKFCVGTFLNNKKLFLSKKKLINQKKK